MVTTRVVASPHPARAAAAADGGGLGIALYQPGRPELAGLGHALPHAVRRLPRPPTVRAWDWLSVALAVFGTDRFLPRRGTPDGWTRTIGLEVELAEPEPWAAEAGVLADALRFLTGDIWQLRFRAGGRPAPVFGPNPGDRDCACLFSGGLDSLIGAADLLAAGRRPLLVSQASPGEGPVQASLAERLGLAGHRFGGRVIEKAAPPYEPSSRSRSVLFLGYGVLAAAAVAADGARGELLVPENGLISVNPPLTYRRLGSLSTRTTHPHLVGSLQDVLDRVGLNVALVNPYGTKTKGEMLLECRDPPTIAGLAAASYSCGKGRRLARTGLNRHCGRCVPCLIRRAAFRRAGVPDATSYVAADLARHAKYDDVVAARLAAASLSRRDVARWAGEAGPLPAGVAERSAYVAVVRRGLEELSDLLDAVRWP